MAGIMDIAPLTEKVKVGDVTVECHGLTLDAIAQLFHRFPDIRKLIGSGQKDTTKLVEELVIVAPFAIATIIALGTNESNASYDMQSVESKAQSLPLETQYDLLVAILSATMPSGFGPFVERVTALMSKLSAVAEGMTLNVNSLPRSKA